MAAQSIKNGCAFVYESFKANHPDDSPNMVIAKYITSILPAIALGAAFIALGAHAVTQLRDPGFAGSTFVPKLTLFSSAIGTIACIALGLKFHMRDVKERKALKTNPITVEPRPRTPPSDAPKTPREATGEEESKEEVASIREIELTDVTPMERVLTLLATTKVFDIELFEAFYEANVAKSKDLSGEAMTKYDQFLTESGKKPDGINPHEKPSKPIQIQDPKKLLEMYQNELNT